MQHVAANSAATDDQVRAGNKCPPSTARLCSSDSDAGCAGGAEVDLVVDGPGVDDDIGHLLAAALKHSPAS